MMQVFTACSSSNSGTRYALGIFRQERSWTSSGCRAACSTNGSGGHMRGGWHRVQCGRGGGAGKPRRRISMARFLASAVRGNLCLQPLLIPPDRWKLSSGRGSARIYPHLLRRDLQLAQFTRVRVFLHLRAIGHHGTLVLVLDPGRPFRCSSATRGASSGPFSLSNRIGSLL